MDFVHKIINNTPRYRQIYDEITNAMQQNPSLDGAIVSLKSLENVFKTSKTPVYQALQMLESSGHATRIEKKASYILHHYENRLKKSNNRLVEVDEFELKSLFKNTLDTEQQRSVRINKDMENQISNMLPFGEFWINEQKAADAYNVSRTIIRQTLSQLSERGLILKDTRSHWTVGPLTSKRLNDLFMVRSKLEPMALGDVAKKLQSSELSTLLDRCYEAKENANNLTDVEIQVIENDLHVDLLAKSKNDYLTRLISQTQLALVVNNIFAQPMKTRPFSAAISEHIIIYEYLARGSVEAAIMALETHILLAAKRTSQRLKALSIFPTPPIPVWLTRR